MFVFFSLRFWFQFCFYFFHKTQIKIQIIVILDLRVYSNLVYSRSRSTILDYCYLGLTFHLPFPESFLFTRLDLSRSKVDTCRMILSHRQDRIGYQDIQKINRLCFRFNKLIMEIIIIKTLSLLFFQFLFLLLYFYCSFYCCFLK